jgi:hypothetical protein
VNIFERVFDQMARMGLAFKSDPIKVIETAGREWGQVTGGLDLSIAPRTDQKDLLSVILRNVEPIAKQIVTRGWLHFLEVHLTSPDGADVPLSAYGRQVLDPSRATSQMTVQLGPNEMVETELPIGLLYEMSAPGTYQVSVSCQLPGGVLTSNECVMKHLD